jgi:hypothetical protein
VRIEQFQTAAPRPDGWVLPNDHLSVTQLNAFLRCERAYQQQYVRGDRAPMTGDLVLGRAVHGAIGWAAQRGVQGDEAAGYLAEIEWPAVLSDEEIDWRDDKPEELMVRGAHMTKTYVDQVVPRLQVDEIEKRFDLWLPGVPVPVVGYVDITQKGTRPAIDIKTSAKAQYTILPTWLLQGRVYQLVEERPIDWHVVTKQASPQVITSAESGALLQAYSTEQAERTRQIVSRLAWRINHLYAIYGPDEDWDWTGITHTFACNRCHWKGSCPGWEGV